jgi:hypothetical protein
MRSEELYYPPLRWYEPEINVTTMEKAVIFNKELEQLFQGIQEDDFLLGKIREALPDNWEDED